MGTNALSFPSRIFVDLTLGTDAGYLPGAHRRQAGMRSASSSAWQLSGLASCRLPLLPRQIREIWFILWLAPTGSALKPLTKRSFANQIYDYGNLEEKAQGKMLYLINLLLFGVRHFCICRRENQNHSFTKRQAEPKAQPWEGKLLRVPPFPITLGKYAVWGSTEE